MQEGGTQSLNDPKRVNKINKIKKTQAVERSYSRSLEDFRNGGLLNDFSKIFYG